MVNILKSQHAASIRTMALRTLAACSTRQGIVAGASHFTQLWTRDACFAIWGSLTVRDYDSVRIVLERITDSIDDNGRVPLRIGNKDMTLPFLRAWYYKKIMRKEPYWFRQSISMNDDIVYEDDKQGAYSVDSASLLIIAWALAKMILPKDEYSRIHSSARMESLERAFSYYERDCRFGLIYQHPYSDWADSIKRKGYVGYSNMLYYAAAKSLSIIIIKKKDYYSKKAVEIGSLIDKRLWQGSYYSDFLNEDYKSSKFSMDANMLSVIFGVADIHKRDMIIKKAYLQERLTELPGLTVYPSYENKHISVFMRIIGMRKYHNGMQWLWIGAIAIMAMQIVQNKIANSIHDRMVENIYSLIHDNKDDHSYISEVYIRGRPFCNALYQSEEPFAWSSGMLIAALDENKKVMNAIRSIMR